MGKFSLMYEPVQSQLFRKFARSVFFRPVYILSLLVVLWFSIVLIFVTYVSTVYDSLAIHPITHALREQKFDLFELYVYPLLSRDLSDVSSVVHNVV